MLLCLIISTRGSWQRSWVNSIARFCRFLLVLIGRSTVVTLRYCDRELEVNAWQGELVGWNSQWNFLKLLITFSMTYSWQNSSGVCGGSCALLKGFLSGSQQRVKISDTFSNWADTRRGVPQESVLGPMFLNIFINDLFRHIKCVKLNAYADDQKIYSSNRDPHAL